MKKNALIGVVAALILGIVWFERPAAPVAPAPAPALGSVSSPDIQTNWLRVGGVMHEYRSRALATATTTPCAIISPAATSTLLAATLQVTTASSTATTWTFATSTTAYATTSLYNTFSLASGALGSMVATTTNITGVVTNDRTVFPPNTFLVWGVAGVSNPSDTSKLNGSCQAEFLVL